MTKSMMISSPYRKVWQLMGLIPPSSVLAALIAAPFLCLPQPAFAVDIASDWVAGHNVETRLVGAGNARSAGLAGSPPGSRVVGIEITMGHGWKTYWRTPGDAGGVPPSFDWTGSRNVARAVVLYPAPQRLTDRSGTTFGYKRDLIFPVLIEPEHPDQPSEVKLTFTFGICREICVPSEAVHVLSVPADPGAPPASIVAEIDRVPVAAEQERAPHLVSVTPHLGGDSPRVTLVAKFPGGTDGADLFVDEPGGEYVPTASKTSSSGDTATFDIDLTQGADVAALKDRELVATLVSPHGQSEQRFRLEQSSLR